MAGTRDKILEGFQKDFDAIYWLFMSGFDITTVMRQYDAKITEWNRKYPTDTCRPFMLKATARRDQEAHRAKQLKRAELALVAAREEKNRADARILHAQAQIMLARR
jgi:hypothetical protein